MNAIAALAGETLRAPESLAPPAGDAAARTHRGGFLRGRPGWSYDRIALLVLGSAAAVLSVWNLNGGTVYMNDEGVYTAQAFSVLDGRLSPYTYAYEHPPLGWIQLSALVWIPEMLGLADGTAIGATRYAMAPFFVATALLIYLIARRLEVRPVLATLSVGLFILSPLSLVFGRQVYLDNIGVTWLLLAFWMALSPRTALWHHIGAGAFFAVAVLSNETLAVFGPALLVALLNRPNWVNRTFSTVGFLVVGGLLLGVYLLLAVLRGELLAGPGHVSLQDALVYNFVTRPGSGWLWDPTSDRSQLISGWLYYDQYLIWGGALAGLLCLLRRRTTWIPVALASFAVPVVLSPGYLPAMYIISALPFLALAVAVGADVLWGGLRTYMRTLTPREQSWTRGYAVLCTAMVIVLLLVVQWIGQTRTLLTQQSNAEWASALGWVQDNVPQGDTVLVPYVMWQDLYRDEREDPWIVVPTEKADLDPQFLVEHPEGWQGIDWVVVGPATNKLIDDLGLSLARQALESSEPVHTVGDWSVHRVQQE